MQRSVPIALLHGLAQTFATAESSCLLHVSKRELFHWLALVVTVIKNNSFAGVVAKVHVLPVGNAIVSLKTAIIGVDTRRDIVADPPLCAVLLAICHGSHRQFDDMRYEFGCLGDTCNLNALWHTWRFCHLCKILFDRDVRTERNDLVQFVAVQIPHSVEVAGSEPLGVEYLFGAWAADSIE